MFKHLLVIASLRFAALCLLSFVGFVTPTFAFDPCFDAPRLDPEITEYDFLANLGGERLLEIPGPGLLAVELNAPGRVDTDALLTLTPCTSGEAEHVLRIAESPDRALIGISTPGRWLVRVEVPAESATPLHLVSDFFAAEVEFIQHRLGRGAGTVEEIVFEGSHGVLAHSLRLSDARGMMLRELVLPGVLTPSKDEELHEVDPDPAAKDEELHEVDPDPAAKDEELHEVDPDPAAKDEELHEVDPDPLRVEVEDGPSLGTLLLAAPAESTFATLDLSALCSVADSFACAPTLEVGGQRAVQLEMSSERIHRFRVDESGWIRLLAGGEASPLLVLYDERGQRLAATETGQLERILAPGIYFLRLSGDSGATYELAVEAFR